MKTSPLEANLWLGFDLFAWLRLLARNRFAIRPSRIPMAALVTLAAAGNTTLRGVQSLAYGRRIASIEVPDDPIFIVGHWRTGTTMLHELLALDPAHRCPNTYESLSPNHFLLTERLARRFGHFLLPRKRPFDNMRMSFDRPQEDECALALRGAPSPFLSVAFPQRPIQSPHYVDLAALTPRQLAKWQAGFRRYLQLLLVSRPGRLVLKSPQHTNRIPILAQMFPRAKFIHIVRDPYVVFPSTMHFWRIMHEKYGLQGTVPFCGVSGAKGDCPPKNRGWYETHLREQVFAAFAQMHENVESARPQEIDPLAATRRSAEAEHAAIPLEPSRFHELRYEHLAADPVGQVRSVYEFLGRNDFPAIEPALAQYAERSTRYKTNEYDLDEATRHEIKTRWAPYFERHGYPT